MPTAKFRSRVLFTFCFLIFLLPFQLQAQAPLPANFEPESEEMTAIQRLIDETFPAIEILIKKGDFFDPLATVLFADDSTGVVEITAGMSHLPDSVKKADALKEALSIGALKGEYKAVAVFYDTIVPAPNTGIPTPAIAVFAEHTNDDFAYLFYFPYHFKKGKSVEFENSFGDYAPQVMYKP